jgi:hypothetical protein
MKEYSIAVIGCSGDVTEIRINLTPSQISLLEDISLRITQSRIDACQPILIITEVKN